MTLNIISVVPFIDISNVNLNINICDVKKEKHWLKRMIQQTEIEISKGVLKLSISQTLTSIRAPTGARKRSKSYNYFRMQTTVYIVVA